MTRFSGSVDSPLGASPSVVLSGGRPQCFWPAWPRAARSSRSARVQQRSGLGRTNASVSVSIPPAWGELLLACHAPLDSRGTDSHPPAGRTVPFGFGQKNRESRSVKINSNIDV